MHAKGVRLVGEGEKGFRQQYSSDKISTRLVDYLQTSFLVKSVE